MVLKTLQQGTIPSFVTLGTVTYVQMIVNLKIQLTLLENSVSVKFSFLYYRLVLFNP